MENCKQPCGVQAFFRFTFRLPVGLVSLHLGHHVDVSRLLYWYLLGLPPVSSGLVPSVAFRSCRCVSGSSCKADGTVSA